jgi:hypothetical protein
VDAGSIPTPAYLTYSFTSRYLHAYSPEPQKAPVLMLFSAAELSCVWHRRNIATLMKSTTINASGVRAVRCKISSVPRLLQVTRESFAQHFVVFDD